MDAQTLFREGVQALSDQQDIALARKLLTESLDLDPDNEVAWLWLSRTTDDAQEKLRFINRALSIDPHNQLALALKEKLGAVVLGDGEVSDEPAPETRPPAPAALTELPTMQFSAPAWLPEKPISEPPAPAATDEPTPEMPADEPSEVVSEPPVQPRKRQPRATAPPAAALPQKPPAPQPPEVDPRKLQPIVGTATTEMETLLAQAERKLAAGDTEGALELWVRVLEIQVDHPVAIKNAVRYLYKLGYPDDARELLWRAVNAETRTIPIYLTAIDLARHQGNPVEADELRERVAKLPNAEPDLIVKIIDHFVEMAQPHRAADVLDAALANHPNEPRLLVRMAELQEQTLAAPKEAQSYYERAARLQGATKVGRQADKALRQFAPIMTDRERGSVWLAVREAAGFAVAYLFLGWQDAGLNLLNMGAARWLGVGFSLVGGYLLVTALSAPQQKPLAGLLGGRVPETPETPQQPGVVDDAPITSGPLQDPTELPILPLAARVFFGVAGAILLIGAFLLVFSISIQLLRNPVPPHVPTIRDLLSE